MEKHYRLPLKPALLCGRHLILAHAPTAKGPALFPGPIAPWQIRLAGGVVKELRRLPTTASEQIGEVLHAAAHTVGTLTVWLARGWEDFVLLGLAELVNKGSIVYKYLQLDSRRFLLRGSAGKKKIVVATLAAFYGNSLPEEAVLENDRQFGRGWIEREAALSGLSAELKSASVRAIGAWLGIKSLCETTCLRCVPATPAALGLAVWRTWLGPRVQVTESPAKAPHGNKACGAKTIVTPSPFFPAGCLGAQRQALYGLPLCHKWRGNVSEKVTVVDVRSAYLQGMVNALLPGVYTKKLYRPSISELCEALKASVGLALCYCRTGTAPQPIRRGRQLGCAVGNFWTWLCGADLVRAVAVDAVQAVDCCYLWRGVRVDERAARLATSVSATLRAESRPLSSAVWRTAYSALAGQFAAHARRWEDCDRPTGHGRWGAWVGGDHITGQPLYWRSVAGRVQRLVSSEATSSAVPLFLAVVLAEVRRHLAFLSTIVGEENVVLAQCDALWVRPAGVERVKAAFTKGTLSREQAAIKQTYDRVVLDGRATLAAWQGERAVLLAPGLPTLCALPADGKLQTSAQLPWHYYSSPQARNGAQRLFANRRLSGLQELFDAAPQRVNGPLRLNEPSLPIELLSAPKSKGVCDD